MNGSLRSALTRYGFAIGLFTLVLLLHLLLRYLSLRIDLSLLLVAAIVFCSWYWGRGPGGLLAFLFYGAIIFFSPQASLSYSFVIAQVKTGILIFTIVYFVSGRRKAVSELGEQRKWLHVTLSSIGDAVIAADTEGRVTLMNAVAEALTGRRATEAAGKDLAFAFRLVDEERLEPIRYTIAELLGDSSNADAPHGEALLLGSEGRRIPVEYNASPIRDEHGHRLGVVLVFRDITRRKQAETEVRRLNEELEQRVSDRTAQLEAAIKELEAFSYSVSHDLRAPLRSINGFSRILCEEFAPQLPEEAREYLQAVQRNGQRMGELVDDLLRLSRLGRQPLNKRSLSLAHLFREAYEDLRAEHESRPVELTIGELPDCEGDPALLRQVVFNLLSNALKYSRGRSPARIEIGYLPAAGDGGEGAYFVRDNGVGFDMRYSDKLFGVFQRLHRMEDYEGTGLGLAIVERIVRRHGGRVWAEAEVDKGACFYFTMAAAGRSPAGEGQAVAREQGGII